MKTNGLCLLCLRSGHSEKICKVDRCRLCELPDHVLLHNEDLVQKHKNSQWYQNTNNRNVERDSMTVAVESNASESNYCCASTSYGCSNPVTSNKEKNSEENHNATSMCTSTQDNFVVLATAVVHIKDSRGN